MSDRSADPSIGDLRRRRAAHDEQYHAGLVRSHSNLTEPRPVKHCGKVRTEICVDTIEFMVACGQNVYPDRMLLPDRPVQIHVYGTG